MKALNAQIFDLEIGELRAPDRHPADSERADRKRSDCERPDGKRSERGSANGDCAECARCTVAPAPIVHLTCMSASR